MHQKKSWVKNLSLIKKRFLTPSRNVPTVKRFSWAFLLLLSVSLATTSNAQQVNVVQLYNQQLRQMFSQTTNPNAGTGFLYDMSSHIADSTFFTANDQADTTPSISVN